uniref:Wsv289-like protein n=1 Tax=Pasiphaea japonica whispovirus TaxID=2984286 RepID=A0A9C7F113_9VIRU|nr:MAG: wsv289-like protein [Pasiphaea japonica whispovirus]
MSSNSPIIERPFRQQQQTTNDSNTLEIASVLTSEKMANLSVPIVNVRAIQCFSESATKFSEGKLSEGNNNEAKIRVKIRPSLFIVETNKEYTLEEISTKSLSVLVKKRVRDIYAFCAEYQPPSNKKSRRKTLQCEEENDGNRSMMENTATALETITELLPVVINIHDWAIYEEKEIRIELKGNQGMEELVNLSHMNPEDWELDRLNALVIDGSQGVFYAIYGILDVVITQSHITGCPLKQPVIFRLVDVNMWIVTPLQLAIPKNESKEKNDKFHKVLYQHPSLTKIEDLKHMASKSLSVSSVLIPEISKFNPAEIELINTGGEKLHYFTAQCIFGKKHVTLDELIKRYYYLFNNAEYAIHSSNIVLDTVTVDTADKKKMVHSILAAHGKSLNTIATTVSEEYDTNRPRRRLKTPSSTSPPSSSSNPSQASMRNPVTCFFGPDYSSINNCVSLSKNLKLHIFFSALDIASINRTLVADSNNSVMEIHESGRFVDLTSKNTVFLPDMDINTLKLILKDNTGTTSASTIASLLFYNNVNLSEGRAVSQSGSQNLSNVIVNLYSGESFKLVGEVATEVASIYRFQSNCDAVLFPSNAILSSRRSYNRQYTWHDPISCVIGLYQAAMDTYLKKIRTGEPVNVNDSELTYMHNQVLAGVLTPFFDAIIKSGAWAIKEVRNFAKFIVESTLLKYSSSEEYHTAFFLSQPILDVMARLVVHYLVMESAAENEGVCTVFHRDPPFIIEPDIALDNFVLSTTPYYIMNGENVSERMKNMLPAKYKEKDQAIMQLTPARAVIFPIPSGRFLKSNEDFKVVLTIPDKLDDVAEPSENVSDIKHSDVKLLLNYTPPKILYINIKYTTGNGFEELRQRGVLTSSFNVTKKTKTKIKQVIELENESVVAEGVCTGFTVDGKIEHISAYLPGSSVQPIPENLSINSTKQAKYLVKELGMETVFFEPLLSSAALQKAAKNKTAGFNSLKVYKECISPLLNNGKILIFPKNSETLASYGFEFVWKCTQEKYGYDTTMEKLYPKAPGAKLIDPKENNVLLKSETGIEAILLTTIKQFQSSLKQTKKNTNNEIAALPSSSSTTTVSTIRKLSPTSFSPSFLDMELFLQHHCKGVIATLISRLMMIVSNAEMKIIKNVSENVSKILVDSLYVCIDPQLATASILERIASEQNNITLDDEGVGYDTLRYAVTGRIFISKGDNSTSLLNEQLAAAPNELRTLFERLRSIGEQQSIPSQQKQNNVGNNCRPSTTTQEVIHHNEQMKKIKDSSLLTAKLLSLIRDDTKRDRITKNITEIKKVYKRTPQNLMAAKPIAPVFNTRSTIPSNFTPLDHNFSTSQDIFVPVNPRDILTDVQWLYCMSTVEAATRDTAITMSYFQHQADETVTELKDILSKWNKILKDVVSESSSAFVSGLKTDWLNQEANRIASIRENAEKSKIALSIQGKIINLDNFGMVAVARTLLDIDFYIKLPNVWSTRDWLGLFYSAVSVASIPLENNIARGIMAASQTAVMYKSSVYLSSAEQTVKNISF